MGLYFEPVTGMFFECDAYVFNKHLATIRESASKGLINELTLYDLLGPLGLPNTSITNKIGWSSEKDIINLDIYLDMCIKDGQIVDIIIYTSLPTHMRCIYN